MSPQITRFYIPETERLATTLRPKQTNSVVVNSGVQAQGAAVATGAAAATGAAKMRG